MDKFLLVKEYIVANGPALLAIWGGVVIVVTAVVKLTPTTKDDTAWAKILKVLDYFSIADLKIK